LPFFSIPIFIDLNKEIYNGEEMIGKNTKNKEHKLQNIYKDKSVFFLDVNAFWRA
jgi:hypothetical protein